MEPQDQTTVSPPTYQLPVTPPRSNKKRNIILASVIVAVLVVVGAVVAAFTYYSPLIALKSVLMMPAELRSAQFISDDADGSNVYTLKGNEYSVERLEGTIVSTEENRAVRIFRDKTGINHILVDGTSVLATSTSIIGVTRSSDGTTVAFAVPKDIKTRAFHQAFELPMASIESTDWRIEYRRTGPNGTTEVYGPTGVSPLFLDDTHIAYLSPAGIYVLDTATGATTELLKGDFRTVPVSVLQSPDHSLIGILDPESKNITVYRVTAMQAEEVVTVPSPKGASSYVLSNDGIYALRISSKGTELGKLTFDGAMRSLTTLPAGMRVNRLITNSL